LKETLDSLPRNIKGRKLISIDGGTTVKADEAYETPVRLHAHWERSAFWVRGNNVQDGMRDMFARKARDIEDSVHTSSVRALERGHKRDLSKE